jgi:O-antigen ligase
MISDPVEVREAGIDRLRFTTAHLAWTAMAFSILIWGFGDMQSKTLGNTGNWYRIVLVLFGGATAVLAMVSNLERLSRALTGPVVLLSLYALFALISSLYIPEYSFYSMWKGLEVAVDVAILIALLSQRQPRASAVLAYRIILALFGILMALYWVEAWLMPSAALTPSRGVIPFMLHGVLPVSGENALAFISAVVALAAGCALLRSKGLLRWMFFALVAASAVAMLILTQSRTSLLGLVVAACVYLLMDRRFGLLAVMLTGLATVAALTTFTDLAERFIVRGQPKELFISLSGRTHAWEAAWALFQESPVIGNGFAAAARAEILGITGASTLHGAIFDVMVGVGLLGLIPWIAAIVWTSVRLLGVNLRPAPKSDSWAVQGLRAEMIGMLALILVRSSTSSGLAMHDHTFMLFLAVVAYTCAASNLAPRASPSTIASTTFSPARKVAAPRAVTPSSMIPRRTAR